MCCQVPPYATIKAFDNTAPFAFNWRDDKADPNDGAEFSLRQSTIFSEVQSTGCKHPNSGGTNGDDACLFNRNVTTGADARENTNGFYGRKVSQIPQGLGATETWVVGHNSELTTSVPYGYRYANAGTPGAAYSLSATTDTPVTEGTGWGPAMVVSTSLFVGAANGSDSYVAKKWNTLGVTTARMLRADLTSTQSTARAVSIVNGGTYSFLVAGTTRTWLLNTSLAEAAAVTHSIGGPTIGNTAFTWQNTGQFLFNSSNGAGSLVFMLARSSSTNGTSHRFKLYSLTTSGMSLLTLTQIGPIITTSAGQASILENDGTRVFLRVNTSPGVSEVRAVTIATGATAWTISNTTVHRARVLTAGLALFTGISGVLIVNPATGTTVAEIDNSQIHDVAEHSSQIFCVGPRRESHE